MQDKTKGNREHKRREGGGRTPGNKTNKQTANDKRVVQAGNEVTSQRKKKSTENTCHTELKKQVESAELKKQRLIEVFQKKIVEFREACYSLTGYLIDVTMENQYRLTSMYAEQKEDCLRFKLSSSTGKMKLLETDFSRTVNELIDLHLHHQNSIPAFLSAVTLELFSRQTMV